MVVLLVLVVVVGLVEIVVIGTSEGLAALQYAPSNSFPFFLVVATRDEAYSNQGVEEEDEHIKDQLKDRDELDEELLRKGVSFPLLVTIPFLQEH